MSSKSRCVLLACAHNISLELFEDMHLYIVRAAHCKV